MPQVIRSLWFEEISFIHEKFFDTPLGKLTARQVAIIFVFGISAWIAFSSIKGDMLKVAITSLLAILCLAFAFQRIKTLTPEQSIMFALFVSKSKQASKVKKKKNDSVLLLSSSIDTQSTETFDISVAEVDDESLGVRTQKLVVLVRERSTGRPLSNKGCDILVNGKSMGRRLTDEDGFLTVPFVPELGNNAIEVKPDGYAEIVKNVKVDVQHRRGERRLLSEQEVKK